MNYISPQINEISTEILNNKNGKRVSNFIDNLHKSLSTIEVISAYEGHLDSRIKLTSTYNGVNYTFSGSFSNSIEFYFFNIIKMSGVSNPFNNKFNNIFLSRDRLSFYPEDCGEIITIENIKKLENEDINFQYSTINDIYDLNHKTFRKLNEIGEVLLNILYLEFEA